MKLSEDQVEALEKVADWYRSVDQTAIDFCNQGDREDPSYVEGSGCPPWWHTHGSLVGHPVMSVGGLAGTGKTTITALLREVLGEKTRIAFAAPTHKAVSVLRRKLVLDDEDDTYSLSTFHSMIYRANPYYWCVKSRQRVAVGWHDCRDVEEPAVLVAAGEGGTGYHVVTSSPSPGGMRPKREDCRECPHRFQACGAAHHGECEVHEEVKWTTKEEVDGCRHLIVVDEASMLSQNDVEQLRTLGLPVLLVGDHGQLAPVKADMNEWILSPVVKLEVNHRQGEGASITQLAHKVRGGLRVSEADASTEIGVITRVAHWPVLTAMLERFECGPQRVVITWTNKTRTGINKVMRQKTGDPEGLPRVGERVISLATSELLTADDDNPLEMGHGHLVNVFNGEMGTVTAVGEPSKDGRVIRLAVKLDDASETATRPTILTAAAIAQLGRATPLPYSDPKRPRSSSDPDMRYHSWDYGYAITAHKAQGSEFDDVIVIDEGAMEYDRWTYTAITRAAKRLVVVKW